MTPDPRSPLRLIVEGRDDLHAIVALVQRHLDQDAVRHPYLHDAGGWTRARDDLDSDLRLDTKDVIGIAIDADTSPGARWSSLRQVLTRHGYDAPDELPPDGLILDARPPLPRVGVWVFPDNRSPGALEDFLWPQLAGPPGLADHAITACDSAERLGAQLPTNRTKAHLHTWLAWRPEPGQPYGLATKEGAFTAETEAAKSFPGWYARLFTPPPPTSAGGSS